jgi:glycosyltransferase involved in cell wall biosynthesis
MTIRRKICLVIPTLQPGGMERVMSELANYFTTREDLEVHLVLYGKKRVVFYELSDKVIEYCPSSSFKGAHQLLPAMGRLRYIRKTVKQIAPDAVLSFGEYWNSFVLLALLGLSYPVFISDRCSPAKEFSFIHKYLRKILYPFSEGVIAQTEAAKQLYKKQFRHNNVAVIGNPIPELRGRGRKREEIVLTVGRLIHTKNHDRLIELFCEIDKPGWKLLIIGGDAQKQGNMKRLQNLIGKLGAEEKVLLAGTQNNMEEFYWQSSIFAFASTSEGFPNVIGEAMRAGLPAVAFDCIAGPSDMINEEENGFLIPVEDYVAFKKRLELLMSDKALRERMGSAANKSIGRFSIENIGKNYVDFILGP